MDDINNAANNLEQQVERVDSLEAQLEEAKAEKQRAADELRSAADNTASEYETS
jgi:prefoldin subunit 5